MAQESVTDLFVDDFYFLVIFEEGEEETFIVLDAKYAEELQLQEAIMASIITSQMSNKVAASSSESNQETSMGPESMQITTEASESSLKFCAASSSETNQETSICPESMQITTEASESSLKFCEICVERKDGEKMFSIDGCIHSFCSDCVSKHVAAKIQDGIHNVTCPGLNCKSVLKVENCRPMLLKGVLDLWEETLCKSLISASNIFYCPFKDCSAMLLNDDEEVIRESECPFCHRLFCVQCCVPWHSGIECEEFQRLNEDERGREDLMVRELVKEKKWSRCPQCKFYVERTEGCPHITCRCQFQFCYGCESEWSNNHGGCQRD